MGLLHSATAGWTLPLLFLAITTLAGLAAGLGAGRNVVVTSPAAVRSA